MGWCFPSLLGGTRRHVVTTESSSSFAVQIYNISAIIDSNFHLDNEAYKREGPLYISTLFAMSYGISFACLASTVVHVLLFHGSNHFICQYYKNQLQLPGWAILLACSLALFFTLQVGVINATTNQSPGLNVITEYIIGYIYPGFPVAIMCFKVYGYVSLKQGLAFLQDFKLGHYMKIPPRSMFAAQELLPAGSPWTCPIEHVIYDASIIRGLIGPRKIFGDLGHYSAINWFFLAGAIAPVLVWLAHKAYPNKPWIKLIIMPVLYHREWWKRHNYVLSGALDAGLAFMGVLLYLCLGMEHISLNWWKSHSDGCPLASCPTEPGVVVKGCPIF
ncbi:hypothetical protein QYF36_005063 [Acer negundo]|nr:hypothetical protein QYF36_005063 [Acer negundo]